ncbi:MAG: hypothetical protein JWO52_1670 [Gammaproteobacteria bacterium]|nr:hypothetical protein [Gammaproteobacteria bacterium]
MTSPKPLLRMSSCAVILQRGGDWFARFALANRVASSIAFSRSSRLWIGMTPRSVLLPHSCPTFCEERNPTSTMPKARKPPDWERLLADAALLQTKLPDAVLVGGTAAALHAHHRISIDHDHVIKDLSKHYDTAIAALESIVGWRTKRRIKGKLVLGEINSIDAELRNHRRSAPLETVTVDLPGGRKLKLPTVEEMLRIKAYLVVQRNATRDYLDGCTLAPPGSGPECPGAGQDERAVS